MQLESQKTVLEELRKKLGEFFSKQTKNGTQYAFKCPFCKQDKFNLNKKKLTLRFDDKQGVVWKCWVADCGKRGKGTKLLLGKQISFDKRQHTRDSIKFDKQSILNLLNNKNDNQRKRIQPLPRDVINILKGSGDFRDQCYSYLQSRGISDNKIQSYNISYSNQLGRLIFPSYDQNYQLNFWTSRRLYGKNPWKHCNGNASDIIFNEFFVNWSLPVMIVQGVFDWLNASNRIPLLGGSFSRDSLLFKKLRQNHPKVILRLDNDAKRGTNKAVNLLINTGIPSYILKFKGKDLGQYIGKLNFKISKDLKFISDDKDVYVQKIEDSLKLFVQSI